jgi:hypothetical protein
MGVSIANAGPGMAVQVMYLVVSEGRQAGGLVGDGHLAAGEKNLFAIELQAPPAGAKSYLAWGCLDVHSNVYSWGNDWSARRRSKRRHLRRRKKGKTTLGAMFRDHFPDVEIPGGTNRAK